MSNNVEKNFICDPIDCIGCGVCVSVCPRKCIQMEETQEGFMYPIIDLKKCVNCKLCEKKCPQNVEHKKMTSKFYMAWHKNRKIVMNSSSGGVFSALAQWVLDKRGVVVGAEFNASTKEVRHELIDNPKDLFKLKLSKYYQSKTTDIFYKVQEQIKRKVLVLFTGTACQIAALNSFLGEIDKKYLITLDVLCHGVASKKVVLEYIKSKEKEYNKKIIDFRFRIKEGKEGWQSGSGTRMKLFFSDGTSVVQNKYTDTYFVGFNSNIFLRESCYRCKYCGQNRISDFTAADFWGVTLERVSKKQLYDGVSVLLVNSDKARTILSELALVMNIQEIDPQEAIPYNRAFEKPNIRPRSRSDFFDLLEKEGFDKTVKSINHRYYRNMAIKNCLKGLLPNKLYKILLKNKL